MPADEGNTEKKNVTCEFCECVLFSDGTVKAKSNRAKKLQKADDEIESLTDQLRESREHNTELETQLKDARDKLAALPSTPTPDEPKRDKRWDIH